MSHHTSPVSPAPRRNLLPLWVLLGVLGVAVIAALIIVPQLLSNDEGAGFRPLATSTKDSPKAEASTSSEPAASSTPDASTPDTSAPAGSDAAGEATPSYMVIGDVNAPVEVKVYSDYLCPHCATFQQEVEAKLEPLIADGTVRLVVQDLVVVDKNASTQLAIAARAAGEQDKFHEFYVAAMEYQPKIHQKGSLELADVLAIAESAGVPDLAQFESDLSSPQLLADVQASIQEAVDAGVNSTPTVFVNGEKLDNPGYAEVTAAIEAAK